MAVGTLTTREAMNRRFREFTNLLDCVDPDFEAVANRYGWEFVKDTNRQPGRQLGKISESGRTQFFIALLLDQIWYRVDSDADLMSVLTYTFGVVSITRLNGSPNLVDRVNLITGVPLGEIRSAIGGLLVNALGIVENFQEPPP